MGWTLAGFILLLLAFPAAMRARRSWSSRRFDFAGLEAVRCLVSFAGAFACFLIAMGRPA